MKAHVVGLFSIAAFVAFGYEIVEPSRMRGTQRLAVQELKHHLALVADEVPYDFVFARPDGAPDAGAFGSRYLVRGGKVWFWGDDGGSDKRWDWGDDRGAESQKRNGTLFAVELFGECELGLRFIWPGEDGVVTTKPRAKTLTLTDGAQGFYASTLRKARLRNYPQDRKVPWDEIKLYMPRELYDDAPRPSTFAERDLWQKRNRLQDMDRFDSGHAFRNWSARFSKTHPEYLNLHVDDKTGERMRGWTGDSGKREFTKHCVSNEAVVDQVVADWCRDGTNRYMNVCENDARYWCECEGCRALDMPLAGEPPYEHITDRYVNFWNRIARKARRIRPDVILVTYAYSSYRLPPRREKVEFGENMLFGFVFGVSEDALKLVDEWKAAGMRHFFFRPNHLCGHNDIHRGLERVFYRQFHELLKVGMVGVDYDATPNRPMSALEFYVLARAFSDPTLSFENILDDYCSGYGAAAGEVKAYYMAVLETAEAKQAELRHRKSADEFDFGYRRKLPCSLERGRNEQELAEKLAMVQKAVKRHEKTGDLSEAEMRRLKSLKLQAEQGLLAYRFRVGVADRPTAEMKAAGEALNAFRVANRKELKDYYDAVYRTWWDEIRYWQVYRSRLIESAQLHK